MAEQETSSTIPPSRSAKFKRHTSNDASPTDMTLGRRAEFRPSEQVAVRRDIVEAYRQGLLRDIAGTSDCDEVKRRAMFATTLADEATQQYDRAGMQLARLRRQTTFFGEEWATVRRVHRALGDDQVVADGLEKAFDLARGEERSLLGLERATMAWRSGEPPRTVAHWVRRVLAPLDEGARKALHHMPRVTAAWAVQLATDAAIEAGQTERALSLYDAFLDHPELTPRDRQMVAATLGLWNYALGHSDEALRYLSEVGGQGVLEPDFEDAWVYLLFGAGDRTRALDVLRSSAARVQELGPSAVVLAQLERNAGDPDAAHKALRGVTSDAVILDVSLELLEASADKEALIDVLNQRLDSEPHPLHRAALLARLGRLYEAEAKLEDAAADVYREALELVPDYAPAIRALGRLYSRRHSWSALVELYEHEIASLHGAPTVWRRQFQVARLYENQLADLERAHAHYAEVLAARPDYLPALKGAARILASSEQWGPLAELFLEAVGHVKSSRQKLYLLDRVAEVAELKLERYDVAIGAWEEILHMDPLHPRAFSSLGRLYARTQRWAELIALNERELPLVDEEEAAALLVRNAEVAEHDLGRTDLAEANYRRVLELLPDYLPALEGLGRIYARGGRWGDLISMTDAQLAATSDPREVRRQLGALAELYESQLDRASDAIAAYEQILALDAHDSWAYFNLLRLYANEQRWQHAFDLIARTARVGHEGQLAMLAEWRLNDLTEAFNWYLKALAKAPANPHWLEGAQRLWRVANADPGALADRLENLLMSPMEASVRDRYFTVLGRLREAAEGTPDAGRAYRAHGDVNNLESLVVMRLCMASNGERDALSHARRSQQLFPWDELVNLDRLRPEDALFEQLDQLSDEERRFIARESNLAFTRALVEQGDGAWTELAAELQRVLAGPPSASLEGDVVPEMLRLRAVEAQHSDEIADYLAMTEAECDATTSRQIQVYRYLEAVPLLDAEDRPTYLDRAVQAAFPELANDSVVVVDGPVYDRLYDTLQAEAAWPLLVSALTTHLARNGVELHRQTHLSNLHAEVSETQLEDFDAAQQSWERCWKLSGEPNFLLQLVRVAQQTGDMPLAARWQRTHFEQMPVGSEDALRSAFALAELLVQSERGEEAVAQLEQLVSAEDKSETQVELQRRLARLHVDFGDARRAVTLFQSVLPINARPDDAADWRTLVRLQADHLGDLVAAYALQWKLVLAIPSSDRDLDHLVDLALDLGELPDCCAEMQALSRSHEGLAQMNLLGRAAVALDEDLNWADDAAKLYEEVLALTGEYPAMHRAYRRRYAFCLARIAGREADALEEFRALAHEEPFEPSNFRGIVDLLDGTQAYDRVRVANQLLVALGCDVDVSFDRPKTTPSRAFDAEHIEEWLLPNELRGGMLGCLRAVMPIAEKLWADELPQRKALDGERVKDGRFYHALSDALIAFGLRKFKLYVGDGGPRVPQTFADGTVWVNSDVLNAMSDAEQRFLAGTAAALLWCDVANLRALDGRNVWHLLEGILLKQEGRGFTDRVDVQSQRLGDEVGGALHTVARRRVVAALEVVDGAVIDAHCEAWGQAIDSFAYRIGLLLCGDAPAATTALLRIGGWEGELASPQTQARLQRTDNAADLLRFAFSDDFLRARHVIGLAGRPSRLDP